jgi:hypothetical protein
MKGTMFSGQLRLLLAACSLDFFFPLLVPSQQIARIRLVPQPAGVVARRQDQRHPIVDLPLAKLRAEFCEWIRRRRSP